MNMVDLRRPRQIGATCAAVAAFALAGLQPVSAEVANPKLVPSESAYIISIPNAPTFWNAWEANGLYDAYKKIMAMPDIEAQIANFRKEMGIVESSLGFKINGETMSQIFGSVDIYLAGEGDAPSGVAIMKITDQEKLTKLIDLGEKAAMQAADGDDDSTGTESADSETTGAITESEYQGVTIKTFTSPSDEEDGKDSKFVYAKSGDILLLSGKEADVKLVIDRQKATSPASGTVSSSEDFKKIDAALAAEKGELYIYGNQDLAMKMQSGGEDEMSSSLANSIKGMMENLAPMTYYGASVKIAPKELSSFSYGILRENSADSLMVKNPGDKPLKVAGYVPENAMLAACTSLFDSKSIYEFAISIADEVKAGAAEIESNDGDTTETAEVAAGLEEKLKSAEMLLGFSVKNDLVPALGNEIAFSLNEVKVEGLIPAVDATLMLGVGDKAKMQKVTDSLERLATNAMAARSADSETSATQFATEVVAGNTIKVMELGFGEYAPGFVLTDDFLIIGSTKASLKNAVEANASGKSLGSSDTFKNLGNDISANANVLQFANLGRILGTAKKVADSMAPGKEFGKYLEVLQVMDVAGSVGRVENGAAIGRGVLKLK